MRSVTLRLHPPILGSLHRHKFVGDLCITAQVQSPVECRPRSGRPFIARGQSVRAERAWTQPRGSRCQRNGGRVPRYAQGRRVPRPQWDACRLTPTTPSPACFGLGKRRLDSWSWARPNCFFLAFTRGCAAKRGSPRAMDGRPLRGRRVGRRTTARTYVVQRSILGG